MMDDRLFRDAMGKFATGITIVTTNYENEVMGMTVNAFMSISLEPKLIAISIDESASMYDILHGCTFINRYDRKSTRLNSSHVAISYAVFCLKKKNQQYNDMY